MQVLLFLTALLSALTGVMAGPRVDEARATQAEGRLIVAAQAVAPLAAAAIRPVQPVPDLVRTIAGPTRSPLLPIWPALLATVKLIQ